MTATAATVLTSPPRFYVAGIARATVRLRDASARERSALIPMAKQVKGSAKSETRYEENKKMLPQLSTIFVHGKCQTVMFRVFLVPMQSSS